MKIVLFACLHEFCLIYLLVIAKLLSSPRRNIFSYGIKNNTSYTFCTTLHNLSIKLRIYMYSRITNQKHYVHIFSLSLWIMWGAWKNRTLYCWLLASCIDYYRLPLLSISNDVDHGNVSNESSHVAINVRGFSCKLTAIIVRF